MLTHLEVTEEASEPKKKKKKAVHKDTEETGKDKKQGKRKGKGKESGDDEEKTHRSFGRKEIKSSGGKGEVEEESEISEGDTCIPTKIPAEEVTDGIDDIGKPITATFVTKEGTDPTGW